MNFFKERQNELLYVAPPAFKLVYTYIWASMSDFIWRKSSFFKKKKKDLGNSYVVYAFLHLTS